MPERKRRRRDVDDCDDLKTSKSRLSVTWLIIEFLANFCPNVFVIFVRPFTRFSSLISSKDDFEKSKKAMEIWKHLFDLFKKDFFSKWQHKKIIARLAIFRAFIKSKFKKNSNCYVHSIHD